MFTFNVKEHLEIFSSIEILEPIFLVSVDSVTKSLRSGKKILFCGNGGSAADSQHIAAELTGRFVKDRPPLAAIALTTDTSALTCISNDYDFSTVFSRQLQAIGTKGDTLIAISTSGNSKNIINAVEAAKNMGIRTIGWLGKDGGVLKDIVDIPIIVPSNSTARIQEVHIFLGHVMCEFIEKDLGFN